MRVVIVGNKNGKAVVRWPQYLGLSFSFAAIFGLGWGLVLYLITHHWSHKAVLSGIVFGVAFVALGLLRGLLTPADKLTAIDCRRKVEPGP